MNLKALTTVLLMSIAVSGAVAQTNIAPGISNWGHAVYGLALSTTLSNETIASGTDIALTCLIKNDSTNLISDPTSPPWYNFLVVLSHDSGASRELTVDPDRDYPNHHQSGSAFGNLGSYIMPKQTKVYKIPLNIDEGIKPGNYKLITKRRILVEGKICELISNTLKIEVVKGSGRNVDIFRQPATNWPAEAPSVKPGVNK